MNKFLVLLFAGWMLFNSSANAAGCIKGAAVGAVAGHVAGHHTFLGAAGGCVVGRHLAKNKKIKEKEAMQAQKDQPIPAK